MSHPDFTPAGVLESIGGQRRRNTFALSRGVANCNECGSRIEAGEPVVFYGVFKDFPNAENKRWHTIATFCSEPGPGSCSKGSLSDVTDKNVGQPQGRRNHERFWSYAPEVLVQGTFSKCPGYDVSKMIRTNVARVIDHSFEAVRTEVSE